MKIEVTLFKQVFMTRLYGGTTDFKRGSFILLTKF